RRRRSPSSSKLRLERTEEALCNAVAEGFFISTLAGGWGGRRRSQPSSRRIDRRFLPAARGSGRLRPVAGRPRETRRVLGRTGAARAGLPRCPPNFGRARLSVARRFA